MDQGRGMTRVLEIMFNADQAGVKGAEAVLTTPTEKYMKQCVMKLIPTPQQYGVRQIGVNMHNVAKRV